MKALVLTVTLCLLVAGAVFAANDEEGPAGSNRLRLDPNVTRYLESEDGVPLYVSGTFAQKVARGNEAASAYSFFEEYKASYRMTDPRAELAVERLVTDDLGMRHLRMTQRYRGLPVIGGDLVVHFTAQDQLRGVNGTFVPGISLEVTPQLAAAEAVRLAETDLASFFGQGTPAEPQLVVFPWEGTTHLAWRLFLYSDTPMGRWEYFIDARSGAVIYKANRIMNSDAIGTGIGVMGAARDHIDVDYTGSTYQMKDYTRQAANNPHGHDGQMPAGNYIQTNIAGSTLPGSIATDADNYWDVAATQRPAVDGQVYTALMYDYLLAHFGRNGYNNAGASMLTIVNYSGDGNDNAYWDGSRIVVWSWSTGWRSLAGCPDVIAHEWGHAVTEYESNLVYQKEPGALNESFSDMIGAAFEFYYDTLDVPDWDMGENGRTTGVAFRSMDNPHEFGDPDTYGTGDPYWVDVVNCTPSSWNDYCGVHTNSGVGNKWFFLLSDGGTHNGVTVTGIGVHNAIRVAYRANAYYWNSQTTYHEAAIATLDAADDLDPSGLWSQRAARAWTAVNVAVPLPGLAFSFPDGVPSTITPTDSTGFPVVIAGVYGGEMMTGSQRLHYRTDGGAWEHQVMAPAAGDTFTAMLPPAECGSTVEFYFSARLSDGTTYEEASMANPLSAIPMTEVTEVMDDNFQTNLGWTVTSTATAGQWQRGTPVGGGDRGDPPTDYDGSGQCYLTGNTDGDSDIDGGTTTLISPTFDLSGGDAEVSYARWFSNTYGSAPNEDVMEVFASNDNGNSWVLVETVGPVDEAGGGWYTHSFLVGNFLTPSAQMKVRFVAGDLGSGSVVEAGVDAFKVTRFTCNSGIPAPAIQTTDVPDWTIGVACSQQLAATGGTGALTWSDLNGDLVGTGLSLTTDGLLTGTPSAAGPITFTALVTDENAQTDQQLLNFTINSAVVVNAATLPDWTAGVAYAQQLTASGGMGARTFSDKLNSLAGTGLTLNAAGALTGTPAAAGSIGFTALATDAVGATGERVFGFTVNPAVSITTASLPDGKAGEAYTHAMEGTGGTGALVWSDAGGTLAGLGLAISDAGLITGAPVDSGTFTLTLQAADQVGSTDQVELSLHVAPAFICGDIDGDGTIGVADVTYLVAFMFRGGEAPPIMAAADLNATGAIEVNDLTMLISYLFRSGPLPTCAP